MKSTFFKAVLLAQLIFACSFRAQALDGAVVIVHPDVPVDSLSADAIKAIYTGKTTYWDGGQSMTIIVLPDKTDAALQQVSGMDASSFKTFWQRLAFSGRGKPPQKAADVAALVAQVAATKGAVALVPADTSLSGVKKIEIK